MKSKTLYFLVFLTLVFSLIKVDYRFKEIPYGLEVDDAEYYYSAVTIGIDFDLDFSNQMRGVDNRFLNFENNKIVPFHPIGSGILASPFVFIANIFEELENSKSPISLVYYIYSFAPIFYFFISILLLQMSMNELNIKYDNKLLLIAIFGTGITYYSFDRFSMSHIYEFFGTSFLIFLSTKSLKQKGNNKPNIIFLFLGFLIFLFLTVRWINYLYFLIPLIIYHISNNSLKKLYLQPTFTIGIIFGLILFLFHTKYLYGIYTLNQAPILLSIENSFSANYSRFFNLNMFLENISFLMEGIRIIFFSKEFGIFFFAPILFLSFGFVLFSLFKKNYLLTFLLFILYLIPFLSVIVVQNTAFSYGYRYLFVLIPINIVLFFKFFFKYKYINFYLLIFSILGFILYIFFETTEATSLYYDYVVNSFGMNTRYSNPNYLSNLPTALLNLNAYMHILFTSFIGVLLIKLINLFTDPVLFFSNFTEISDDIASLISNSLNFSWPRLFFMYIFVIYFLVLISKNKANNNF